MDTITEDRFGRDHWSALAFIETVCVDHAHRDGSTDIGDIKVRQRLRCNPARNPLRAVDVGFGVIPWEDSYGTRLNDGSQIGQHDDWDCLGDLDAAGMIELIGSQGVRMTARGLDVAAAIRRHKAQGGTFATFKPDATSAS